MTKKRFKFIFIILWLVGVLFLSIPTFSFNVAGQTVNVNYSDRLARKLNTTLGSFERSSGVFNSEEVKSKLNFQNSSLTDAQKQQSLLTYLNIVTQRIQSANLYDVTVKAEVSSPDYSLVFDFPEYYQNPAQYAQWLTAQANLTFSTADQSNPQVIPIYDYNIIGSINLDYLDSIGTHLVIRFDSSLISTLNSAFSSNSQGAYFLMSVDGLPAYFVVQYDQYANSNDDLIRAFPTQALTFTNTKQRTDYLNITRSYFLTQPLKDTFNTDSTSVVTIKPLYRFSSATVVGVAFVISAILLGLFFLMRFKFQGFIKYLFAITTFILSYVAFLKVINASISISFLLSFILTYFVINSILYYLLENVKSEEKIKEILRMVRDLSVFGFLVFAMAYKLLPNLNQLEDFIGIGLIAFIVLFVMSIIHFKFIFEQDFWTIDFRNSKLFKKNETK